MKTKTKKKNRLFKRLSREQKAVAIAQDVIKQLELGRFIAKTATYCDLDIRNDAGKDLQKIIKRRVTKTEPCTVCAIGAGLVSAVRLFNDFQVPEYDYRSSLEPGIMRQKLRDFFEEDDLYMLESCFERASGDYLGLSEYCKVAAEWSDECETLSRFLSELGEEERLIWLMNVIITNEGHFSFQRAKRAALVTLGTSTEERWITFRQDYGLLS